MSEVKQYRFSAIIHQSPGLDASYIEFPYDVFTEFGTRAQVKVAVQYDGIPYRTSLANMGTGCHLFVLPKEIRKKLNKTFGDTVSIVLQKDEAPRTIDIPSDLLQ